MQTKFKAINSFLDKALNAQRMLNTASRMKYNVKRSMLKQCVDMLGIVVKVKGTSEQLDIIIKRILDSLSLIVQLLGSEKKQLVCVSNLGINQIHIKTYSVSESECDVLMFDIHRKWIKAISPNKAKITEIDSFVGMTSLMQDVYHGMLWGDMYCFE